MIQQDVKYVSISNLTCGRKTNGILQSMLAYGEAKGRDVGELMWKWWLSMKQVHGVTGLGMEYRPIVYAVLLVRALVSLKFSFLMTAKTVLIMGVIFIVEQEIEKHT